MDPEIIKLLALQEEDAKKIESERQLAALPKEIASLEKKIADEKVLQESENKLLKDMELRRLAMRTERLSSEEMIRKYKTQQMQVKKNEEYTALTNEIERLNNQVSEKEEIEISLLMEIDEASKRLSEYNAISSLRIREIEKNIIALKKTESDLKSSIKVLTDQVNQLASNIKPQYISAYNNVKLRYKRPPFVVPIIDRKSCGLRVSGECESAARRGTEVVTDENSGRIVYYPDKT